MKTYSTLLNRSAVLCASVLLFWSTNAGASVNPIEIPTSNVEVTSSDLLSAPPATLQIVSLTPFDYNGVNIRCFGQNSGRATVVVSGGVAPYTYAWSAGFPVNGGTTCVGLYAGAVTCTVTDALGFSVSQSVTLTQNPPLQAIATVSPILCNGGVATITLSATGGTPFYSGLNWYDVVPPGPYNFTVADANGCRDQVSVVVTEPPVFEAAATASPILCHGDLATVAVEGFGGTGPYSSVGLYYEAAGTSTYAINDANGCWAYASVTINQPQELVANVTNTSIDCRGGETQITVTGLGGTTPYTGTGNFTGPAGPYQYTVTDANGCQSSTSVMITQPQALVATIYKTPVACSGDLSEIELVGSGGTAPYMGPGFYYEPAGLHEYTISDANGCSVDISTIVVEPREIELEVTWTPIAANSSSATTNVEVVATGGTPSYVGTGVFSVTAGTHYFTVTDANGCSGTEVITVAAPAPNNLVLANGNNHGSMKADPSLSTVQASFNTSNEEMEISYQLEYDSNVEIEIYDMAGALVETIDEGVAFEGQNYTAIINSGKLTNGVYVYHFVTDLEHQTDKLQIIR